VVALALEFAARGQPPPGAALTRALASGEATARLVGEAARAGDPVATAVFSELGRVLGIAIANIISVMNPAMVIVGGGVALAGEVLLNTARVTALARVVPPLAREVEIVPAALGDRGGMLGAALLALSSALEPRAETALAAPPRRRPRASGRRAGCEARRETRPGPDRAPRLDRAPVRRRVRHDGGAGDRQPPPPASDRRRSDPPAR
jgi:hypothetical protein